jgi:hypothetical protein
VEDLVAHEDGAAAEEVKKAHAALAVGNPSEPIVVQVWSKQEYLEIQRLEMLLYDWDLEQAWTAWRSGKSSH